MAITVNVRADNAIVIYDEDDPRFGVAIHNPSDVAALIYALSGAAAGLYGEQGWKRARMRAVTEAVADYNERLN